MPSSGSEAELRELVRRHQVTWQTRPELAAIDGSVAPIGFVVELAAVPEHPVHAPGGPECSAVEDVLERLAHAVAPSDEIEVLRGQLQIGTAHDQRPELSVLITLLHRGDVNRPPDAEQKERMDQVVERLRALGAQEGHWREGGPAGAS